MPGPIIAYSVLGSRMIIQLSWRQYFEKISEATDYPSVGRCVEYNARYTSPVCVVSQCKLVSG